MRKIGIAAWVIILLGGCHESLEKRCARETSDFTKKNCPAVIADNMRIDSMTFDPITHTIHYYYTMLDELDNDVVAAQLFRGRAQFFVYAKDVYHGGAPVDSTVLARLLGGIGMERFRHEVDTLSFLTEKKYIGDIRKRLGDAGLILFRATKNDNDGRETLLEGLKNTTAVKVYKDNGYAFAYTYHSEKNPDTTYYSVTFGPKDYK